jgi:hypothetical protein
LKDARELPLCDGVNAAESVAEHLQCPGIVGVWHEPKIRFEGCSRDNARHRLPAAEQDENEATFIGRDLWFRNRRFHTEG